jgi:PhzF family phenazine biosynthesis protein
MTETPLYQVDAFTDEPFRGNPAAVCVLDGPREPAWMQCVAAEMNLSETAFVHAEPGGGFRLRWFTPAIEVPLCGHATLATAHILWQTERVRDPAIQFHAQCGTLTARRAGDDIVLDFPSYPVKEATLPPELGRALGVAPVRVAARVGGPDRLSYIVELGSEAAVRAAAPDFGLLAQQGELAVMLTAAGGPPGADFVSRFFVPYAGIDEDPVTGSAHCMLGPYWADALGKQSLVGYQASARGGWIGVDVAGDRVHLRGRAVTVMRGTLLA